jgi:hypothetical protein
MLSNETFYSNICSDCKLNDVCTKKKDLPKFLPFVQRIVKYAYSHINQSPQYLFHNKGIEEQPIWFMRFLDFTTSFIIDTRKHNQENKLPNKQ